MGSIQEVSLKIKNFAEDAISEWGLIAIVFLVGLASFGLGRLSALEDVRAPVSITEAATTAKVAPINVGGMYVAAKTGAVYYFPWCTGATKIAAVNQRWF